MNRKKKKNVKQRKKSAKLTAELIVNINRLNGDLIKEIIKYLPLLKLRRSAKCKNERGEIFRDFLRQEVANLKAVIFRAPPINFIDPESTIKNFFVDAILKENVADIHKLCGLKFVNANTCFADIEETIRLRVADYVICSEADIFPIGLAAISGRIKSIAAIIESGVDLSLPIYIEKRVDISTILYEVVEANLELEERINIINALSCICKIPNKTLLTPFYCLYVYSLDDVRQITKALVNQGWTLGQETNDYKTTYEYFTMPGKDRLYDILQIILQCEREKGIDVTKYRVTPVEERRKARLQIKRKFLSTIVNHIPSKVEKDFPDFEHISRRSAEDLDKFF